jgi:hypothetical protein
MRLDVPLVDGEVNTPLLQAVQAADFASGVAQIAVTTRAAMRSP